MTKALVLWTVEHLDEVACADRFLHGLQRKRSGARGPQTTAQAA